MTELATTTAETMERAWKELERHKVWMLTTVGADGLHARPMHAVPSRAEHCIWFVSERGGVKDNEIARENHVGLTTCDGNFYMAVSGTAEIVEDRQKMKDIWSTPMQAYFPEGPLDPRACLLKVTPQKAELWDGSNSLIGVFKMVAAIVQKERADLGEHHKTRL